MNSMVSPAWSYLEGGHAPGVITNEMIDSFLKGGANAASAAPAAPVAPAAPAAPVAPAAPAAPATGVGYGAGKFLGKMVKGAARVGGAIQAGHGAASLFEANNNYDRGSAVDNIFAGGLASSGNPVVSMLGLGYNALAGLRDAGMNWMFQKATGEKFVPPGGALPPKPTVAAAPAAPEEPHITGVLPSDVPAPVKPAVAPAAAPAPAYQAAPGSVASFFQAGATMKAMANKDVADRARSKLMIDLLTKLPGMNKDTAETGAINARVAAANRARAAGASEGEIAAIIAGRAPTTSAFSVPASAMPDAQGRIPVLNNRTGAVSLRSPQPVPTEADIAADMKNRKMTREQVLAEYERRGIATPSGTKAAPVASASGPGAVPRAAAPSSVLTPDFIRQVMYGNAPPGMQVARDMAGRVIPGEYEPEGTMH